MGRKERSYIMRACNLPFIQLRLEFLIKYNLVEGQNLNREFISLFRHSLFYIYLLIKVSIVAAYSIKDNSTHRNTAKDIF